MHNASYLDIWIYFFIAFVFIVLISKSVDKKTNEKYGLIAFYIIYCFAVFRYDIGNDYRSYWQTFLGNGSERTVEPLSGLIINFVQLFKFPPLGFFIFATISLCCYRYVIKRYSSSQTLSWYFYFAFPSLFFQDCSTLRQAGAMGLFFVAFALIDNKKYIKGIIFLFLSVAFHYSAIICFIVLFLPLLRKIRLPINVVLFIGSFLIGSFVEDFFINYIVGLDLLFSSKLEWYVNAEFSGNNSFQYVLYAINIANFIFYKSLCKIDSRASTYITLVNIGLCLYNIFQFETQTAIRFSTFFMLFAVLLIPMYISILSKYTNSPQLSGILLCLVLFLLQLSLVIIYINAYNNGVLDTPVYTPYKLWFNHF